MSGQDSKCEVQLTKSKSLDENSEDQSITESKAPKESLPFKECPVCMNIPAVAVVECLSCAKFFCEICITSLIKLCVLLS